MSNEMLLRHIDRELHDLCQPLANLSCHLELALRVGDEKLLRPTLEGSWVECEKMVACVTRMRHRLLELRGEMSGNR